MTHLFISYSRSDSDFVNRLILALEQYGFRTWQDKARITGGEDWKAAISRAVRECDAFLLVLSPNSTESDNVSKELSMGTNHGRPVVPVLFEPCVIPDAMAYDLTQLQWVDFSTGQFNASFEKLVTALGGKVTTALRASREVQDLRDFIVMRTSGFKPPPPDPEPPVRRDDASSPSGRRFCIHCATKLVPGNAFCTGCGRPAAK